MLNDNDIGVVFKKIYISNIKLLMPVLVIVWLFLFFLILFNSLFMIVVFPVYFFTVKTIQFTRFNTDRSLCYFFSYYPMQKYLHDHFEKNDKWFVFKYHALAIVGFNPYYRCRSVVLKDWYHKRQGRV